MLYLNVIFRQLILDIYCNMIMNGIDSNDEKFASHYQNILIVKELQKGFGEMYFGSKKTILSDNFFITTNTRINNHMDAGEFDGFFHRRLLENPFKYNIIHRLCTCILLGINNHNILQSCKCKNIKKACNIGIS